MERLQKLGQARERKFRLGFDPGRREDSHAAGVGSGVVEQCALADAGFAPNHQRFADARAGTLQQGANSCLLALPPEEHGPILGRPTPGRKEQGFP